MISLTRLSESSLFAGLGNYDKKTATIAIPAQSLTGAVIYSTSINMDNVRSIASVYFRLAGYKTNWTPLTGQKIINLPNYNSNIQTFTYYYFDGTDLVFNIQLSSLSGTQALSAITVEIEASLFIAPFD